MTAKLTGLQADAMQTLGGHVGATVDVLTSQATAAISPAFVDQAVGIISAATLRGLESKGFVKIVRTFWRGATVEVLKEA